MRELDISRALVISRSYAGGGRAGPRSCSWAADLIRLCGRNWLSAGARSDRLPLRGGARIRHAPPGGVLSELEAGRIRRRNSSDTTGSACAHRDQRPGLGQDVCRRRSDGHHEDLAWGGCAGTEVKAQELLRSPGYYGKRPLPCVTIGNGTKAGIRRLM